MSDYIVGITGGIGSGKTTVSNIFAELGISIIDADIIAREVVEPKSKGLNAIINYFGNEVIDNLGQLNRSALRQIVFDDQIKREWLNNLLHPLIREQMILQTKEATSQYCLLVVPLLIENKLTHLVDRITVIDVDETTQKRRASSRDNSNGNEIQKIIDSQINRHDRVLAADDIIENENSSVIDLKARVKHLHKSYLKLSLQK